MSSKLHSPPAERNAEPIFKLLSEYLPESGSLLVEVASGTGQHASYFAPRLPKWTWQPTDFDKTNLESVEAYREEVKAEAPGLLEPIILDASKAPSDWPFGPNSVDAIYCANMIHIAPWTACLGLLKGAGSVLKPGTGQLFLYGPYFRADKETAPSNLAFDESLKSRNSEWGIRQLETVVEEAGKAGLKLEMVEEMPANNLFLRFQKRD